MPASETVTTFKNSNQLDEQLVARALELAAQGIGQVSPGPLVGCVIVDARGGVVGEGFYRYDRLKHAETYALEQAGERARGGTAYVSLEPHAHHGRTPPCTNALIEAGISRVVVPTEDPNPKVAGKGFSHLRAAGIEVSVGLLTSAAEKLNEKYFHFMRSGRPFVHLKLAASLDGKIATRCGDSRWITGEESRARVHELRHEYDAILVGAGTVLADDPLLTDRSQLPRHKLLTRIILDEQLKTPTSAKIFNTADEGPVIIFAGQGSESHQSFGANVEVVRPSGGSQDVLVVLDELAAREIQSVLIEGGATVAGRFLDAGLVDKISFFTAPLIIGGKDAPAAINNQGAAKLIDAYRLEDLEVVPRGSDVEFTGYPRIARNPTEE